MKARGAQSMVEVALTLPILALLIAIGIDFARIYQVANTVHSAARLGAEYGATHRSITELDGVPTQFDVHSAAEAELGLGLAPPTSTIVAKPWDDGPKPGPGQRICVKVTTIFYPITPMAAVFMPSGQLIEGKTLMSRTCTSPNCTLDVSSDPCP